MTEIPANPDVRGAILDAARQLFAHQGFAATSLRQVAETAGVTKPMVYYYFGSKEGLYQTLLSETREAFSLALTKALIQAPSVEQKLVALARTHAEFATDRVDDLRVLAGAMLGPSGGAPAHAPQPDCDPTVSALNDILDLGIKDGQISVEDRVATVFAIRGAVTGFYGAVLQGEPPEIITALPERIINVLWRGIAGDRKRNDPENPEPKKRNSPK